MDGRYYCSCKSDTVRPNGRIEKKPWKQHVTETDENNICIHCGYYAEFISEDKQGKQKRRVLSANNN